MNYWWKEDNIMRRWEINMNCLEHLSFSGPLIKFDRIKMNFAFSRIVIRRTICLKPNNSEQNPFEVWKLLDFRCLEFVSCNQLKLLKNRENNFWLFCFALFCFLFLLVLLFFVLFPLLSLFVSKKNPSHQNGIWEPFEDMKNRNEFVNVGLRKFLKRCI